MPPLGEGVTLTNFTVATFTDSNTTEAAGEFTATIDWGDGTTTVGIVTGGGAGNFTVSGTHTYVDEETGIRVITTLTETAPGAVPASATSAIFNVTEGDALTGTASAPTTVVEGTSFNGSVATFTGASLTNTAADFTATINWGDGTATAGTVSGGG